MRRRRRDGVVNPLTLRTSDATTHTRRHGPHPFFALLRLFFFLLLFFRCVYVLVALDFSYTAGVSGSLSFCGHRSFVLWQWTYIYRAVVRLPDVFFLWFRMLIDINRRWTLPPRRLVIAVYEDVCMFCVWSHRNRYGLFEKYKVHDIEDELGNESFEVWGICIYSFWELAVRRGSKIWD